MLQIFNEFERQFQIKPLKLDNSDDERKVSVSAKSLSI